jgi:hypothetical protein
MITREIREGSSPTMRSHFGCICKATAEYKTGVWCLVGVLYAYNGHLTMAMAIV